MHSRTTANNCLEIEDMIHVARGKGRIYFYARVDYSDIYDGTPRHHTETTFEVTCRSHPDDLRDPKIQRTEVLVRTTGPRNSCS
jgi:hypothetical protein